MKEKIVADISSLNDFIKRKKEIKMLDTKKISDGHHTFEDLYERECILFRLITCIYPKLSFKTLYHYDEENDPMFDNDFMVGIYTPKGPVSYHFKLKYLDYFEHLEFSSRGPKFDNYNEKEKNDRINFISKMVISGKTEDEILDEIINNSHLDDALKPNNKVKKLEL